MTLREQLLQLQHLLGEDVFTDAPEYSERVDQIRDLSGTLEQVLYRLPADPAPLSIFSDGLFNCPTCGEPREWDLIEHGYTVTHDRERYEARGDSEHIVVAEGWDGNSAKISEEGTHYGVECKECGEQVTLPSEIEIDWK